MDNSNNIVCPKCGSNQLTADKKGFSGGKAVAGAVLLGPVGLLAGTHGSSNVNITCLACGHTFKPGEGGKTTPAANELDMQIRDVIMSQGKVKAILWLKNNYNWDGARANNKVHAIINQYNLQVPKAGCAGIVLILIALSVAITGAVLLA